MPHHTVYNKKRNTVDWYINWYTTIAIRDSVQYTHFCEGVYKANQLILEQGLTWEKFIGMSWPDFNDIVGSTLITISEDPLSSDAHCRGAIILHDYLESALMKDRAYVEKLLPIIMHAFK